MSHDPWNRPLPSEIPLGGGKRFNLPLSDPNQRWLISAALPASSGVGISSQSKTRQGDIHLMAEYLEGDLANSQADFPVPPTLDLFSWDWLEFHYHPLQNLAVEVTHWVPDPRVICGLHRIHNQDPGDREISLLLTCQSVLRQTIQLSTRTFQGRNILTGSSYHHNLSFFLSGNARHPAGQQNQLISTWTLEPDDSAEIRWVLAFCSREVDPRVFVDEIIQLDWSGEIARRKIRLNNQLQIKTGDPDRDFSLAYSQQQALLILNQHLLQAESNPKPDHQLTPFQIWQLILALTPLDPSQLERLLEEAAQQQGEEILQLPLQAEILWRARQAGLSPDALLTFLPGVAKNLKDWFTPVHDKDQDGIPEIATHLLFPNKSFPNRIGDKLKDEDPTEKHIEHPGVAALLHNDISQLITLEELFPDRSAPAGWEQRKNTLKEFILASWLDEESRFRTREYQSHLSKDGYTIPGPFHSGWNKLRATLPHPSRLILQLARSIIEDYPSGPLVTFHGRDWQGHHRVEEIHAKDIQWHKNQGWGITESIFSRLDHCVLAEEIRTHQLKLKAPQTDQQDISLTLPFWMDDLPQEIGERLVRESLTEPARFWSGHGLKTFPTPEPGLISLPWNLVVVQGLIRRGFKSLASDIIFRWVDRAASNLHTEGVLYSTWDSSTGAGGGKVNQLEGCLPSGLLLDLAGVRFQSSRDLVLEDASPCLFPIQLIYRGVKITLEEKETILLQPGGEEIRYPRGQEVVIHL